MGVAGYKGSGKTTAADFLVNRHGFRRVPLAQILKDMLRVFGLTEAQVRGADKEVADHVLLNGKTARWAMQTLGTEWGRVCIDDNVWVQAWWMKANRLLAAGYDVVCDDVRFLNEFEFMMPLAADMVMVKRAGCGPGEHASEQLAFTMPSVINNNASMKALRNAVDTFAEELHR